MGRIRFTYQMGDQREPGSCCLFGEHVTRLTYSALEEEEEEEARV
jgi:hypothetical protein